VSGWGSHYIRLRNVSVLDSFRAESNKNVSEALSYDDGDNDTSEALALSRHVVDSDENTASEALALSHDHSDERTVSEALALSGRAPRCASRSLRSLRCLRRRAFPRALALRFHQDRPLVSQWV